MTYFQQPISEQIWDIKYRYRYAGESDQSIEDTWRRVAKAVAKAERTDQQAHWENAFYDILKGFRFLPGGRILAGAGTQHKVTLFNCFVMPVSDSLVDIFDALKEGALTLQEGGGVGYDFSLLRPLGYPVEQAGAIASGPVSFMKIWNAMCATMQSTGARRGAMMGILRCDHPDIEEFISAKSNPHELRHFNVSVLVTDEFMDAVQHDRDWELVFPTSEPDEETVYRRWSGHSQKVPCRVVRTVKAATLWERIIRSAYDYAEPGVVFEDTINRQNNLWYCEWISATNPCGEIPLPPYGACNLGAINLTQFVFNPFTEAAAMDWQGIKAVTQVATRFLDNVIDVSRYPLASQASQAHATRRIGLGFTGLADVFIMLGLRYGSAESLDLASKIMKLIAETTWEMSIELARERGPFPFFNKEKYLQSHFVKTLSETTRADIEKYGIRNSHHNTIAPTGTISLLANNVSNGLEPVFSAVYQRSVRTPQDELIQFTVEDYVLALWKQGKGKSSLPPAWIDSQTLLPEDHLRIQAAVQPYIDNSISKTINLPIDFPFEKLNDIYTEAFRLGLKGCTIFRPNLVTGSVLSLLPPEDESDRCCQIG